MKGLFVALLVAASAPTHAEADDPQTVVLVGGDAAFSDALDDVLLDTRVHAAGTQVPPALAQLATESRRLADASTAYATVWLSPATTGATLVTYERRADRFLVRELPYGLPLSATQAAEAARMVRTMLRALRTSDDTAIVNAVRPEPALPVLARRPPALSASLGIGAWFAAPAGDAEPQTSLAIAWRPHDLGVALTATFARASDIEATSFRGDIRDSVLGLELRKALRIAGAVRAMPAVGLAVHAISLAGTLDGMDGGEAIDSQRFDPAFRVGIAGAISMPSPLELGLGVSADCLLRRQRYDAGTERILVVPRVQAMASAWIGFRL